MVLHALAAESVRRHQREDAEADAEEENVEHGSSLSRRSVGEA